MLFIGLAYYIDVRMAQENMVCPFPKVPISRRAITMNLKTTQGGFEPGAVWLTTARATD